MATKKAKRKTPVKRKATTAKRATPAKKKKAKPRKKKGLLGELMTAQQAQVGAKAIGTGTTAAMVATGVDLIPGVNNVWQSVIDIGLGFAAATVGRSPLTGAGLAAIGFYKLGQEFRAGLSEGWNGNGSNIRYANPIERLPLFLNENNQPLLADPSQLSAPMEAAQKIINSLNPNPGYSTNFGGY